MRISKLTRVNVVLGLLFSWVSPTVDAQQHHHGFVKFCNTGDTDLLFTLVTREGTGILVDRWRASGRYSVNRQSCEFFAEDVSVAVQMYVGVRRINKSGVYTDIFFDVSNSGSEVRQVDETFCTRTEAFDRYATLTGHTQCPLGYSLQPFHIAIVLPPLIQYTLSVGESPGAGPNAPRQSALQLPGDKSDIRPETDEDCWYVADDEDSECAALRARSMEPRRKAREATQVRQPRKTRGNEGDYLPIVRVAPIYPARALSRGIEGYADISFTVTTAGTVRDPIVLFSTSSLFERAATRAVLKFKYKPRVVDGRAIEVTGVKTRVTFKIER